MPRPKGRTRLTWEEYPCPVCTAGPGDPCVTWSGIPKSEPHADRARLASENNWQPPREDDPGNERANPFLWRDE